MVNSKRTFAAAATAALLSLSPSALAHPASQKDLQVNIENVLAGIQAAEDVAVGVGGLGKVAEKLVHSVGHWVAGDSEQKHTVVDHGKEELWDGMKVQTVIEGGKEVHHLSHPAHPNYKLRITSSSDPSAPMSPVAFGPGAHEPVHPALCDPDVRQMSGYLDILPTNGNGYGKHLFFWFFESRNKPSEDPLLLWLNGGPGCSSTTGLLFELGPCQIADGGNNVTYNPHSWTNNANVIFLDQPVGVGYSYSDAPDGMGIDNSPAAAEDVYAFLTLFVGKFSKYRKNAFHISGESYAGTYLPNIAHTIHTHNKELLAERAATPKLPVLNFESILIGNGLTEAATQFGSVSEYACDSEYAVYKDPQGSDCQNLRTKLKRCENLVENCYKTNSKFVCVPAGLLCWSSFSQLQDLGLNMYDTRRKCDRSEDADGPLCYREMGWIETWMNRPEVRKAIGADDRTFASCNMNINKNFLFQGDAMHNSALLLTDLIEDGIRLLVYAGVQDLMCNFIGNEEWVDKLPTSYLDEFHNSTASPFIDSEKKESGYVRSAGHGAGNVAYMAIYEAGHMVPQDQPVASLDMLNRWLANKPLAKGK